MKHRFRFSKESKERIKAFGQELQDQSAMTAETKTTAEQDQETATSTESNAATAEKQLEIETRTNIGMIRASNQDTVIQGENLIGVADGMGGHNGGETASAIARDTIQTLLKDRDPDGVALTNVFRTANRKVYLAGTETPALNGMGTTLTVLWMGAKNAVIGHVGDSRCYRLRDGKLEQLTDDHSLVMDLVRVGIITKDQAAVHPMRNVITRAIGTDEELETDILTEERQPKDIYLICSDGLHGMIPDEKIQQILLENDLAAAADKLIAAALEAGGRDNVSVSLLLDREGAQ